jgi:hypothetical protein
MAPKKANKATKSLKQGKQLEKTMPLSRPQVSWEYTKQHPED